MPDPASPSTASQLVLRAKQVEIDAVRQLAGRAELVDLIGQLTHALQRERGASSVYLASQGRRFASTRQAAVAESAAVEDRLRTLFMAQLEPSQGAGSRMLSLMAWVQLGLDSAVELRARIEQQALSAQEAVGAFSRLISGLVDLIFHVADTTLVPGISRLLVAFLYLVQGKESAGQERAVGALLYASGVCSQEHQQQVLHLIDAQERSLRLFAQFADPALAARWEQQQLSPGMARLERLRRTLCTARPGVALDSNLSDDWFEVCSDRIGEMWQWQVELVTRLREACEAQLQQAHQDLLDSEGLLRRLRDAPPHTRAAQRLPDLAASPEAIAERHPADAVDRNDAASVLGLLQAQSARLASMEAELDAARRALHERKVIERAKGVLMARLALSEEAAFRALQKASMDQNRRLLEVAEATLALPDFAFAGLAQAPAGPRDANPPR